ncbi:MAG: hypothetical protein ACKO9H_18300, partial [Planctomycetota bacterium]
AGDLPRPPAGSADPLVAGIEALSARLFGFSEELRGRPNLMVGAHSVEPASQMHAGRRSATHPTCLVGIFDELKRGSAPIGGCVNSRRYGRCRTCAANRRLRHAGQGKAVESPDGLGDES